MNRDVTVIDLIQEMERRFPTDAAEEWDNPGLLAGRFSAPVSRIFVTLDVSDEALQEAVDWEADLILSHHPLIFGKIQKVNDADVIGRRLVTMLEQQIAYYAMHTNYDVCRMADLNGAQLMLPEPEVLEVTGERDGKPEGFGRVGTLAEPVSLRDFAAFVKERMRLPDVIVYGDPDAVVHRAAVSGGSGKSMIAPALAQKAEVLVTGDIDYHAACDAVSEGLCIIDAGHYGTEYCFIKDVAQLVRQQFPQCEVKEARVRHPHFIIS